MKSENGVFFKLGSFAKENPGKLALALLTVSVYALLFGIYMNNDIDDAWLSAWAYNFWNYGMTKDVVFCEGDDNYWGVRFFSHVFCYLYGAVFAVFGVSKSAAHLSSLTLVAAGLGFWTLFAQKLFKDKRKSAVFFLTLAWSGVVFATANKTRADALVFCLAGASVALFANGWRGTAAFLACVAVETHPIGAITFVYLFAYALHFDSDVLLFKRKLDAALGVLGLLAGLGFYFLLHHEGLGGLLATLKQAQVPASSSSGTNNFLVEHFFGRSSFRYRYIPDLLLFAAAFSASFLFRGKEIRFLSTLAFLIVASTFVFRRGNFHYAVFAYPAFLLLVVDVVSRFNKRFALPLLAAAWLLLMLPQYLFLAWRNSPGREFSKYISELRSTNLPKDAKIYGMPSDWFAFYDRPGFRSITSKEPVPGSYEILHEGTLFQQSDASVNPPPEGAQVLKRIPLKSGGEVEVLLLPPKQGE